MIKKITALLLAVATLLSAFAVTAFADDAKIVFSDVDATTTEGTAIYKLAESGIVNGNGDGTFRPNNPVTRAELCKMINNIWKFTEPAEDGFKDVTENKWYYDHVRIAKKAGYINGFADGTFRGDSYVTREQTCAILCRVAGLYDIMYAGTISDQVSPWAQDYVKKVLGNGLMFVEAGDKFRATQNMKRVELSVVLANFVTAGIEEDPKPDEGATKDDLVENNPVGGGGGGGGDTEPEVDYTEENKEIIGNLTSVKAELIRNRELFTAPQKEIIDIVIDVLGKLLNDQDKFIISTETVYEEYTEEILDALDKYKKFDSGSKDDFISIISQLSDELYNFLEDFFGIDFSDI